MATLFSRIIVGEIPSHKVAEDANYYAFLDIAPVQMGHVLVVPKREEDYIFDLSNDELSGIFVFAKRIEGAIRQATASSRVGIAVVGLEVNHAHVHLVPINEVGDMDLSHKLSPSQEQLAEVARAIRQYLPADLL